MTAVITVYIDNNFVPVAKNKATLCKKIYDDGRNEFIAVNQKDIKDYNSNHDPKTGEFSSGDTQLSHADVLNAVKEKLKDPNTLKSASDTAVWSVTHFLLTNGITIAALALAAVHLAKTAVKLNNEFHILEKVGGLATGVFVALNHFDSAPNDQYQLSQEYIDHLVRELKVNEQQLQALRFSVDGKIIGHSVAGGLFPLQGQS